MLHVPLEADSGSKHVTVLGHVADPFARGTLNVRQEGAPIAVWTGQSAGATGNATTPLSGSPFRRWWASSVRRIVHIATPRVAAFAPPSVVVRSLSVGTAHLVNPRNPLHPRQVAEEFATIQEIIILKDTSNTRGNDVT